MKSEFFEVFRNLRKQNICRLPSAFTYPTPNPNHSSIYIKRSTKKNKKAILTSFSINKNLFETSAHEFFEQTWK